MTVRTDKAAFIVAMAYLWTMMILLGAIVLETFSLRTAHREAKAHKGPDESWIDYIRHEKSPELPVVLLEDIGADAWPAAKTVWKDDRQLGVSPINVQPFAAGDLIYGINANGVLTSFQVPSGERLLETPQPVGSRPANSATAFLIRQGESPERCSSRARWRFSPRPSRARPAGGRSACGRPGPGCRS